MKRTDESDRLMNPVKVDSAPGQGSTFIIRIPIEISSSTKVAA